MVCIALKYYKTSGTGEIYKSVFRSGVECILMGIFAMPVAMLVDAGHLIPCNEKGEPL